MVWMGLVRWWLHEKPLTGASFIRCGDFLISYRVYTCKAHVQVSSRPDSIVTVTKTTHALSVPRHWELDFIRRGCSSLYMIRTGTKFSPPYSNRVDLARVWYYFERYDVNEHKIMTGHRTDFASVQTVALVSRTKHPRHFYSFFSPCPHASLLVLRKPTETTTIQPTRQNNGLIIHKN